MDYQRAANKSIFSRTHLAWLQATDYCSFCLIQFEHICFAASRSTPSGCSEYTCPFARCGLAAWQLSASLSPDKNFSIISLLCCGCSAGRGTHPLAAVPGEPGSGVLQHPLSSLVWVNCGGCWSGVCVRSRLVGSFAARVLDCSSAASSLACSLYSSDPYHRFFVFVQIGSCCRARACQGQQQATAGSWRPWAHTQL